MPKVKVTDDELNIAELEEAEYSDQDFDSYTGELPPSDTVLVGYIKSMWWTVTKNNDRMFKVLFVAADNEEDEAEYDGLPIWDNPFFTPAGKFRWQPFIDNFGITLKDIKTKLYLEKEDHPTFGAPVEKVGTLVPGGDTAWARVLTKIGYDQNGERRVEVKKWLPLEDEEPEDVEDEEPDEEPDEEEDEYDEEEGDEEYDEDEEEDEEEGEEEEPEPPARTRATSRRPAPKAAAKAAPARRAAAAKPATRTSKAAPARGTTRRTAAKAAPAKAAPTRGRRRAQASQDEPPF